MANKIVAGEMYESMTGQLFEIGRQLRQPSGYPFDPAKLQSHLQAAIEGRFADSGEAKVIWTVTSDGRSAEQLIVALEAKGIHVSNYAKDIMGKPAFKTMGGMTHRLVAIRGDEFEDDERTTKNIFKEAKRRGYRIPPAEVAPLLREKFSQEELGLPYVAVFHEPIRGSFGGPVVLELSQYVDADWLSAWGAYDDDRWIRGFVFVFLAPQVSQP